MNNSSLHRQLVLPYVLLVVFVAAAIGWVFHRAGAQTARDLGWRAVDDLLQRTQAAIEFQFSNARRNLDAVLPTEVEHSEYWLDAPGLERRLWLASRVPEMEGGHVYFVGEDGFFTGVRRVSSQQFELLRRLPDASGLEIHALNAFGERGALLRMEGFARERYMTPGRPDADWRMVPAPGGADRPQLMWSRAVHDAAGRRYGILAIEFPLERLAASIQTLPADRSSVALIADAEGKVIASSTRTLHPGRGLAELGARGDASEDTHAQRQPGLAALSQLRASRGAPAGHWRKDDGKVQTAGVRVGRDEGLDWYAVAAVPHGDFMAGITRSLQQAAGIAFGCVLIALFLGLSILNRVLRDIRALSEAARRVGLGEPLPALNISRRDELGQLAASFSEMEHNLRIDKLTAVFNRASLTAQIAALRRQLQQRPEEPLHFALLFIDLDHFKKVNDQYGHAAGDRVLVTVAARLKESVRMSDAVARYGGDEFVVLLKGVTDARDVLATQEKIRQIVLEPVELDHVTVSVGVSIGWAMFPEDGKDVDKLLKIADGRMYETKRSRQTLR